MGKFMDSAAFAEQTIYRRIAKHGSAIKLTDSQRAVLIKFVNLWFYHRGKSGAIEYSQDDFNASLDLSDRAIRGAIGRLMELGIVIRIAGGVGRGNVSVYGVDLTKLQEVLAPEAAIQCAGETVSLHGEIKVARSRPSYRDNKYRSDFPSRVWFVVRLRKAIDWTALGTVLRRIAANARAWFRPRPQTPSSGWNNYVGALS
ncbi:hypothetical protein [Sphingobium fuliginis]|jgi:hypothetical protein|uniref:hypothetical protein n=1 Tax=Sphingobium fuliginis (strain ATCC 27551) TaxID=336203 RepID=UPI0037C853D6